MRQFNVEARIFRERKARERIEETFNHELDALNDDSNDANTGRDSNSDCDDSST